MEHEPGVNRFHIWFFFTLKQVENDTHKWLKYVVFKEGCDVSRKM